MFVHDVSLFDKKMGLSPVLWSSFTQNFCSATLTRRTEDGAGAIEEK
jgi:hypothetical protein